LATAGGAVGQESLTSSPTTLPARIEVDVGVVVEVTVIDEHLE
jgi:hypothetical protein